MNAASFHHLIYSPADKGTALPEMEAAVQAYPWCQPLRVALSVRAYEEGSADRAEYLGQAAVHAFSRARLRHLHEPFLKDGKPAEISRKKTPKAEPKPEEAPETKVKAKAEPDSTIQNKPAPTTQVGPRQKATRKEPESDLPSDPAEAAQQTKLIDDFLASQEGIRLSRKDLPAEPAGDLAAKSVSFDGLIISETMARMYMRQGQPEKAAYIVSQLSLKFPEKSAYFAGILETDGPVK